MFKCRRNNIIYAQLRTAQVLLQWQKNLNIKFILHKNETKSISIIVKTCTQGFPHVFNILKVSVRFKMFYLK